MGSRYFNPLPPHGGRPIATIYLPGEGVFQSTPSAWRETCGNARQTDIMPFQSTPSAWRETIIQHFFCDLIQISIHSLRMEGDQTDGVPCQSDGHFNPLPPHGGRRPQAPQWGATEKFQSTPSAWRETCQFNSILYIGVFQSTPSAWRETIHIWKYFRCPLHFNPLPPHGGRLI